MVASLSESQPRPPYEDLFDDADLRQKHVQNIERSAFLSESRINPVTVSALAGAALACASTGLFLALRLSPRRDVRAIKKIDRKYKLPELPRTHPDDPVGVGVIVPLEYDIPAREYGGVERDADTVARSLGQAGIRAFVFATNESTVAERTENVELIPVLDESLTMSSDRETYESRKARARERVIKGVQFLIDQGQVDLLDIRWEDSELLEGLTELAIRKKIPLVMHFSGTPNEHTESILSTFEKAELSAYTTLSRAHRQGIREKVHTNNAMTLSSASYGISLENAPSPGTQPLASTPDRPTLQLLKDLQDQGKNYVIHAGTIGPRKSQAKTIEAFKLAKTQGHLGEDTVFIIMGEPSPALDDTLPYYKEHVLPYIDAKDVFYFGPADEQQKWELLRFALASMFASGMESDYTEAFCRLLAESAVVGTPVVGFASDTFREVMKLGVTGLEFTDIQDAAVQLGKIRLLDRTTCANYATETYSEKRMIKQLIADYRFIIKERNKRGEITIF